MTMTLNELMAKHNFIVKILLSNGNSELSKDLKVKIMSIRIEMGKIRKQFETDLQELLKGLTPEGYSDLLQKESKTKEDEDQISTWNDKINSEYNAYVDKRGKEEVSVEATFTEDEFNEIVEVNAGNDVEINGVKLSAPDFLEVLYSLFVA
jgi:hypothetical protein